MYETYFGLKRRPFLAVPDTESYFSIPQMETSRQSIERAVRRGEGISLVVGASGVGKTLLLRLLRKSLEVEYAVSLIANGHLQSPKAFFQQLLYELRLPFSNADETELRLMLCDFARQEETPGLVLLVDEAQFLSPSVLEEIRLLMNCDDGAVPFFRAVLAGTIEFEETLTHPNLEAFNQRIACRSYLEPLTGEETSRYISWQTSISRGRRNSIPDPRDGLEEFVRHSGRDDFHEDAQTELGEGRRYDSPHVKGSEPIFTPEAKRRIFQLTEGVPRLINQVCDFSMQSAAEKVARQVDESLVLESWSKLQQVELSPLESERPSASPPEEREDLEEIIARKKQTFQLREFSSSVEFGALEDSEGSNGAAPVETEIIEAKTIEPEPAEVPVSVEETVSARVSVGYKPPYPEDDEDEETGVFPVVSVESEPVVPTLSAEPEPLVPAVADPDSWAAPVSEPEPEESAVEVESEEEPVSENPAVEPVSEIIAEITEEPAEAFATEIVEDVVGHARSIRPIRRPIRYVPADARRKYRPCPRKSGSPPENRSAERQVRRFALQYWVYRAFDMSDPWIGNHAIRSLFVSGRSFLEFPIVENSLPEEFVAETEIIETEPTLEEPVGMTVDADATVASSYEDPLMDREALEKYGEEVLEGRPPFVRKEPNYVYNTTDGDRDAKRTVFYPDPATGNVIELNWILPARYQDCGFGTAYCDYLLREENGLASDERDAEPVGRSMIEPMSEFESSRIVRVSLGATETEADAGSTRKTSIDELFDEVHIMDRLTISLDEAYRPSWIFSKSIASPGPELWPGGDVAQRQLESVVLRITEAADKIEQAALVTEDAGRHVKQAAEYVENEVQSALPTYKEMFVELSTFQKTISRELRRMQAKSSSCYSDLPETSEDPTQAYREQYHRRQERYMEQYQEQRSDLLPFPKRPDFHSPEIFPAEPEVDADTVQDREEGTVKDEKSIDVRTLFQ